ncbi:carbamoyl-phosphate synthase large subunit [Candidatus Acetothermia bacterium]|jgi:carbamoyl-phosphate synthase large subunit|nr:carbamoyl-phosphate synthase large subunit [Candidatus Acetothermia bacterium]MCI2431126.1 carbamoyl-phosphate synthase large subunit [Candidatus Acetothermia bacterium]MCI2437218.1 carbamoyl-phosphate synthase large subunit [Candidatus Acetothermia bacterium]
MPKRTDLKRILVIGSGPIVIGQAGEFDYSGSQACKALREEGYEVILVNNNPATIMTDPESASRVYIEPLVPETLEQIIARERPDALLPTVGGQTALNLAVALAKSGVLARYGVESIGAQQRAIEIAEDRLLFKQTMETTGLEVPQGALARSLDEALSIARGLSYPILIRPSFTLGGEGSGVAQNEEELYERAKRGLDLSPVHEVLIEESVIGWKEFELEVMRDRRDNVVIICSIENFDPMGVHTGDSITVAPAQTLSDKEYQKMRDWAIRIIRAVGVETGGSNIQFAVHPRTGRILVIEMNPRVSRSSALASKATGFPIAKIAAKLAVGYTLDELPNDITQKTPASFEPAIDYVVVKIPRWNFEKFPQAERVLGTQMRSVGEVMALGRTFKESLQKAVRSLEIGRSGLSVGEARLLSDEMVRESLQKPNPDRVFYIYQALQAGTSMEKLSRWTGIDPWFLGQIQEIVLLENELRRGSLDKTSKELLWIAKKYGFSDARLAKLWRTSEMAVRRRRLQLGVRPVYKKVDTCAAEFEAQTPYLYSTYETGECEAAPSERKKVIVLGGGPYRIGQGIEFDYCCCHAAFALRALGYETVMINCNPETVSTDYDTSDKLYFEPLTLEDVLHIMEIEKPVGVIVQFGGQTPLNLALALHEHGVPIWGTSPESIDLAEDREKFDLVLSELGVRRPRSGIAYSRSEAFRVAEDLTFPLLVRPSYVLGGRAMAICYDKDDLERYIEEAVQIAPAHPILIDEFLQDAIEIDVDAVADGRECVIGGILEHIERAGIHSGDSCSVISAYTLSEQILTEIRETTRRLAQRLKVIGLMNVQYAVQKEKLYVLEVNPRASRTVPFVSKATGVPWAKIAANVMAGMTLRELGLSEEPRVKGFHVKAPVFPFDRFMADPVLGPEMKSTGEVMGSGETLGEAFAKTQLHLQRRLPTAGTVFISVNDRDKPTIVSVARALSELGFVITATRGTAEFLRRAGVSANIINKVSEGHPHIGDAIRQGQIQLVINTPWGKRAQEDERAIRIGAVKYRVPYVTTLEGAQALVEAIRALRRGPLRAYALEEFHCKLCR